MNDIKGIIEDVEKSDLVSDKIIKKVIEIIGQEKWQEINDKKSDICTTTGELIITLKGIPDLEEENAELEEYKNGNFVQTVNQIIEGKDKRLEQAKKIIKGLLSCCRNYPQENAEKMKQAEQFLKGEDIILEDAQAGNSPFDADEVFNKEMKAYPEEKVKKEIE